MASVRQRTFTIDGVKITIKSRVATTQGNLKGWWVNVNEERIFKSVLTRDEAEVLAFANWQEIQRVNYGDTVKPIHHIKIGKTPWCCWSSSQAGREVQKQCNVTCEHGDYFKALCAAINIRNAARKLEPHFKPMMVTVWPGPCPV